MSDSAAPDPAQSSPLRGCLAADGIAPPAWAESALQAPERIPSALPCRWFAGTPREPLRELIEIEPPAPTPSRVSKPRSESRAPRESRHRDVPVPVGAVLDKYRLEEVLGKGAFAAVYRATHLLLRTPVAIKMLLPKVVQSNPRLAAMLCEEARLAARVDHPNVVRVWDVSHNEAITYIVMEFVEGSSLSRLIAREKRIDARRLLSIGLDCCAGLDCALQRGVIHRDIKPSNILIAPNGVTKIIDLGLARRSEPLSPREARRSHLPPDAVVGTFAYMSPEQAEQPAQVDFRTDVYSLGTTLYHAASGSVPFSAKNVRELRRHHARAVVTPLSQLVPGFPPEVSRIVERMMAKERSSRPSSYAEISAAMQDARHRLEASADAGASQDSPT